MSAKVVPMPRARHLVLSLDDLVGFEGVKTLAKLLQEEIRRGVLLKDISHKANLLPKTVSRIMTRETMAPRMLTCIMIFKALGFSAVRFDR